MSLREEFLALAQKTGVNFSELCRRFGISRKTGYKWRRRYREKGVAGLADRSRRPQHSPKRSQPCIEKKVLAIRDEYGWRARKIKSCLERAGEGPLAKSTVHEILLRHERVSYAPEKTVGAFRRFEKERPNELWQMDFKGHFSLARLKTKAIHEDSARALIVSRHSSV